MPAALHRRIGQLAVVGFAGTSIGPELRSLAREFSLGGIILFKRNVESPEQVLDLSVEARQLDREVPPWVGVDQEGGRVARMKSPLTEWPPMQTLGRADDEALARRFGAALARELRAVGISIDFAPVLDVLTSANNPAIGDRALSNRPEVVARLGAAVVRALQEGGVAACGKHFPGHGDTTVDSHLDLPIVEHPPERLREIDFAPFRAAIEAGVAAVMTGHLLVPAFDEENPATLSRAIVTGHLREELGFDGLVFSDDLDMKAISARMPRERAVASAVAAGCDVVLMCGEECDQHASALESLVRAVEEETLPRSRVDDAMARQRRAKARFAAMKASSLHPDWRPMPARELRTIVGCAEHQLVAEEMRRFA